MSLQTRLADLVLVVGTDYKQLRTWITGSASGNLTTLTTTDKTSLVSAINEVKSGNSGAPPTATTTVTGVVRLATTTESTAGTLATVAMTPALVAARDAALKTEILGGAGPAFDTLMELQTAVVAAEESDVISALTTVVGNKANTADIYTRTELGNIETDLVAAYTTAKA